ncbi:MAG: C10 family peptidase [Planctomycetota bacterium]|jgi:hypothetical protein
MANHIEKDRDNTGGSVMHIIGKRKSLVFILIAIWMFCEPLLIAGPVHLEQVQKVTGAFLSRYSVQRPHGFKSFTITAQEGPEQPSITDIRQIRDDGGTVLAYVAELEPHGFIAMSANTDIAPIVAYSFRNPFPGDRDTNPLYRMLKEDMKRRAKALVECPEFRTRANNRLWNSYASQTREQADGETFQQWPQENTTSTGGWVDTAWDQDTPYNDLCPLDPIDANRCVVGCVATAMAQVLNYHKECNVNFSHSDAYTSFHGINVDGESALYDFPSFPELNDYLAVVRSKYRAGLELDDTDAAALSFASGVAIQMDYSSEGSGAYTSDVPEALLSKFNFHSAEMVGGLSCEFFPVLEENLINGLPALFSIKYPDGFVGHVIICDGYNTDGEYHLNFGWGSERPDTMTEAWYRLPMDIPTRLCILRDAILNIKPDRPSIDIEPVSLMFYSLPGEESEPQTLCIENNEAGTLINSISCPEGFLASISNGVYSEQIDSFSIESPGEETLVNVKFYPDVASGYNGVLKIEYNDSNIRYVVLNGCSFEGGTEIPVGEISGRWSKEESPYFISGDITLAEDGVLIIEPGVQVMFVGPYSMTIGERARLVAMGSETDPIEFTAWNKEMGWTGLRFVESGNDDILRHCVIMFSKKRPPPVTDGTGDYYADLRSKDVNSCGGAVYCYRSDPTITNCKITNNVANKAGAIYCDTSNPVISNTLIANNSSMGDWPQCGGICAMFSGIVQIENCTIVNNSPGGVFPASWDGMDIVNTIVWGNNRYQIETFESTPTVSFSDVQGGYKGEGNIDADPCFFAPSSGVGIDYDGAAAIWTLKSSSPCINSGTEADLPATDLAGNPRIYSDVIDMGAYENQSDLPLITISPSVTLDANFIHIDTNSVMFFEIINTGKADIEVENLSLSDANGVFSILTAVQDSVLPSGGSIQVEVGFAPTQEMTYKGTLFVHSTASNDPNKPISLRGVGVSGTVVPGGSVNGTWMKAESPYVVTGDIYVPVGRSLTIEPGALIKFAGHFGLTIRYHATLEAVGTSDENIVFTATNKDEGWFGIRFVNSERDDVLKYCTIEYAKKPSTEGGGFLNLMGGGILCCGSWEDAPGYTVPSSPTIDHCLITNNEAEYGGGIMITDSSDAIITNCRIVNNSTDTYGGGIFIYWAYGTVANNVIAHNSGVLSGGIANWSAFSSIRNNTIVHNRPNGLYLEPTEMSFWESAPVLNNIIWQNEMYITESVLPSEYDIRFNDIQGGWRDQGNIDIDPCFVDPESRDYHIQSEAGHWDSNSQTWIRDAVTSQCIDAGNPDSDWTAELWPHGKLINMGAFGGTPQASMSLSTAGNVADLNNNDVVDGQDLLMLADVWLSEDIPLSEDINRDGVVNFPDFALLADDWLWQQ